MNADGASTAHVRSSHRHAQLLFSHAQCCGAIVVSRNLRAQNDACLEPARECAEVAALEYLRDAAVGHDSPTGEQHDVGREARDLVDVMSHVQHRDAEGLRQLLDVRQDLLLARHVEGRQRLVHEHEARAREQVRARSRRAAARRPRATECGARAGRAGRAPRRPRRSGSAARAPGELRRSAKRRFCSTLRCGNKPAVLEHVADAAPVRRHARAHRSAKSRRRTRPCRALPARAPR